MDEVNLQEGREQSTFWLPHKDAQEDEEKEEELKQWVLIRIMGAVGEPQSQILRGIKP